MDKITNDVWSFENGQRNFFKEMWLWENEKKIGAMTENEIIQKQSEYAENEMQRLNVKQVQKEGESKEIKHSPFGLTPLQKWTCKR